MLKNKLASLAATLMIAITAHAQQESQIINDASYIMGSQVAENVKVLEQQISDFDKKAFLSGVSDALLAQSKFTHAQEQEIFQKFQAIMQQRASQMAAQNSAAGKKFQEDFAQKKGVKKTASGVLYLIERQGSGETPKLSDTISVHYEGKLIDGTVFDSSYQRGQAVEFALSGVIKGWQESLVQLKKGGKMQIVVPSELAYGDIALPNIPAHSTLIFTIELLDIKK